MRYFKIIILFFLLVNCTQKEVKLPTLATNGIQEVYDHSQVWIFFTVKNSDTIAEINRNNTISSTHWIYNIDKRLPLKTFIPSLSNLKFKHANSIHSKEGMHDYFSYSDTQTNKLSFFEFDNTTFKADSIISENFIKNNYDFGNYNNIHIIFNPNSIFINTIKVDAPLFKEVILASINSASENQKTMLHLNFNQNMVYQDYLYYKTLAYSLINKTTLVNSSEFIFNKHKVPNCNC